jgi:hypothetical protein
MRGLLLLLPLGFLLLLTLVQSRRPLPGRAWAYVRALFPSWRFFEDVEPGPELQLGIASSEGAATTWHPVLPAAETGRLFLNARGNLRLAYQSLVEQLESELDGCEVESAPQLISYRLVRRLVQERALASGLVPGRGSYRFRLWDGEHVVFESRSHEL